MSAAALASVGDHGVLNTHLSKTLAKVWIDRDSSWLDFNERVLAEALDERTPLLERLKFLAIFTSNLDEFFMKRVTVLRAGESADERASLARLRDKLTGQLRRQAECFRSALIPELNKHGIRLLRWKELDEAQKEEAGDYFDSHVSPALTPLVIDPAHPFPFLSNLSTSLIFFLKDALPKEGAGDELGAEHRVFARVKVPAVLKQWVRLASGQKKDQFLFVPLYEVIRGNVHKLYAGMTLSDAVTVRLTRDAEVEMEADPRAELREIVREQIRQRRYEPVVRLEFGPNADPGIRNMLRDRFRLVESDLFDLTDDVDFTTLFELSGLAFDDLKATPWTPVTPHVFSHGSNVFSAIASGDILVHHPYESFDESVEHFISAAAADPQTVSIKMTAYRIGDDTPFVKSLIQAAELGKQVACVMEIKARFDEERNLHWAAELERVGAHVTFGVAGLKTHAKVALVVRKEDVGLRCYVHIGTGNYHVKTAKLYADVGLFTSDPAIAQDAVNLFHHLTGFGHAPRYQALLVAPESMRSRLVALIEREIDHQRSGRPARIVAKMNQLEDPEMIEALCHASRAGVEVDLIVRGFCCLRPGVEGITERIRVRSIIGRFLEHSRIFHFLNSAAAPEDGEFYIGSADWMYRNLSKRVEVVTPVLQGGPRRRLWEILDICLRDQRQAWSLRSDGSYTQLRPEGASESLESIGTHQALMNMASR